MLALRISPLSGIILYRNIKIVFQHRKNDTKLSNSLIFLSVNTAQILIENHSRKSLSFCTNNFFLHAEMRYNFIVSFKIKTSECKITEFVIDRLRNVKRKKKEEEMLTMCLLQYSPLHTVNNSAYKYQEQTSPVI